MRISRDFKSVQETSTFSPGKHTFQYFVVPLQTVSVGRQNHVCFLIQQLSAKSHFTAQKMPRPPESLKSKSCQRKLVINLPHLCRGSWRSLKKHGCNTTAFILTNTLSGNDKPNKWRGWNKLSFVYCWHSVLTLTQ